MAGASPLRSELPTGRRRLFQLCSNVAAVLASVLHPPSVRIGGSEPPGAESAINERQTNDELFQGCTGR